MSLLKNFVPPEYRTDRNLRTSILLILSVNIGILIYAIIIGFTFWKLEFTFGVRLACATIAASLLFFPLTRYNKSTLLNGCYFTLCSLAFFTAICLGTGGIHSPYLPWFLTVPAAIFFYIEKKYALPWVFLTIGCVILVAISSIMGVKVAEPLPDSVMIYLRIINFIIMTYLLVRIVYSFRHSYRYVNKKLSKTVEKLEETNEDLQNFAYIASHDLQTPLKSINSTIKALKIHHKNQKYQADPIETTCLEFVENNTARLANLVEDILDYSRAGQHEPQLEKVDLNQIIQDIRQQVTATGQYPNFIIKSVALPTVITDRTMIFQIFQNIIENGLKYNNSKHPAILVDLAPDMKYDHLTFTDNGIGIKAEDQDKVFGMFKRVGETQKYQGTGIGLAICKRIIDERGGKIWLTSVPGQGTIFHLEIPKKSQSEIPFNPETSTSGNDIQIKSVPS